MTSAAPPQDWYSVPVSELISISHGLAFKGEYFSEYGRDAVTTPGNFLESGGFRRTGTKQRYYSGDIPDSYRLSAGDLIVAMTEQAEGLLGSAAFVPSTGNWLHNQRIGRIRAKSDEISVKYLYYFFNSFEFRKLVAETAAGTKVKHTSPVKLGAVEILLPLRDEQDRITGVLDDAEALIMGLENLVAKKHAVKQGMIQQLLTGKTRLPGFTEPWREFTLSEVLTVRHGKSQRSVEVASGRYPILATGGRIGWARSPLYSKPSVLIGRKGTIDRPQYQDQPFWTVDTLFYTEISPKADPRFLYYVFLTVDWRSMNEASGVPSLSSTRVESVEVLLPELAEQVAIRTVLDDADQEICLLESRLSKARATRIGMLQQLLTGRTRLPAQKAMP